MKNGLNASGKLLENSVERPEGILDFVSFLEKQSTHFAEFSWFRRQKLAVYD